MPVSQRCASCFIPIPWRLLSPRRQVIVRLLLRSSGLSGRFCIEGNTVSEAQMDDLSYDEAGRLLRADFATGKLYWLPQGDEAFTTPHIRGYRVGNIHGKSHLAHRVIWLLAKGHWPEDQIDHINGIRDDNRIDNLRAVDSAENSKNQGRYKNNKSGVTGVLWHNSKSKWRAQIRVNGREFHLGYFVDFDKAVETRKAADVKFGFHENHGRVAA